MISARRRARQGFADTVPRGDVDYTSLRRVLLKSARALAHDESDAEDLVQTALLKVFEHPIEVTSYARLRAWLATVMRHLAIDSGRRSKRWRFEWSVDFESLTLPADMPADGWGSHRGALEAAIERCAPAHGTVCKLYYLSGLSYPQIAAILAIPMGTVGTRMRRGRKSIVEYLRGTCPTSKVW